MQDRVATLMQKILIAGQKTGIFRDIFYIDRSGDICSDEWYTNDELIIIGEAAIMPCNGTDDHPLVDVDVVKGSANQGFIISNGYRIGFCDEQKFRDNPDKSLNLDRAKLAIALLIHEQAHNRIAMSGDPSGLPGLFTAGVLPKVLAEVGAAGSTEITNKLPEEIVFDFINTAIMGVRDQNLLSYPSKILCSYEIYKKILTEQYHAADTKTILQVIVEHLTAMGITDPSNYIVPLQELNNAGVGGSHVIVALTTGQDSLSYRMTADAYPLEAMYKGTYWESIVVSGTAGIQVGSKKDHLIVEGL